MMSLFGTKPVLWGSTAGALACEKSCQFSALGIERIVDVAMLNTKKAIFTARATPTRPRMIFALPGLVGAPTVELAVESRVSVDESSVKSDIPLLLDCCAEPESEYIASDTIVYISVGIEVHR